MILQTDKIFMAGKQKSNIVGGDFLDAPKT